MNQVRTGQWQWPANPPGFDPESGCSRGVAPDPRSESEWGWGEIPRSKKNIYEPSTLKA
jgi:hypothetical protein